MKVNDLINRQCQLKKEKRALEADWDKLADDFLNRPFVFEFLKMHNASFLNFDYLEMWYDDTCCDGKIDLYVWWGNCHEKELICRIDPNELDKFMTDDTYMTNLLKEKAIEEERLEAEKEAKKRAENYKLYMQLKEVFENESGAELDDDTIRKTIKK